MARFAFGSGSYPEYAQASAGGATFPPFAAINEAYAQQSPNQRLQFGDQIIDKFGNVYTYVRAAIALAQGQVVRYSIAGDSNSDHPSAGTISANTTAAVIVTNITTTLDEAALGSFLASQGTLGGTGVRFFKQIKAQDDVGTNTQFTISKLQIFHGVGKYDGDALSAVPTTSDPVTVIRPYNVVVGGAASATEASPVGVAQGTVSQAGGTLILSQGFGQVLGVGNVASTDAIVAGGPLYMGAAGTVTASLATETAASDLIEIPSLVGRSMIAHNNTSALIPAYIQCGRNV